MNDPTTTEEWMTVARERGADAEAMLPTREASVGPVYMAGYAVECAVKGYLQHRGIPRPRGGQGGHNLKGLWKQAGFRLADLRDADGSKSFFIEQWSTAYRYQANIPQNIPKSGDLIIAARRLARWLQAQTKRERGQK